MITRRRIAVVIAAASCVLTVAGVAAAVTGWNVGLNSGSSASAQGNGFAPPTGSTSSPANASLTISWTAGAGATPDHYMITRNGAAVPAASGCTGNQTGPSCVDSGLQPNTTYTYVVTAVLGNWTTSSTSFTGKTTGAAFGAIDLGNSTSCAASLTSSNHVCAGPSVKTTGTANELILVTLMGSNEGTNTAKSTIASISGPFTGTPQLLNSSQYDSGNGKNAYVYAWTAVGSGNTTGSTVSVTFDAGTTQGSVAIDVVELGAGNSVVNSAAGSGNGGSTKAAVVSLTPNSTSNSEVAFLASDASTTTFAAPTGAGWSSLDTDSNSYQTSSNATVQNGPQTWTMANAQKNYGFVAIEVKVG